MVAFKNFAFCTILASAFVSAAPYQHQDLTQDWPHLSSILDNIDDSTLHNVLHNLSPKFRDGVFSKDRAAIEHVHSVTPVLASKLVYIAKRQINGTTTSSGPVSTTSASIASVAPTISNAVASLITAATSPSPTVVQIAPSTGAGETPVSTISGAVVLSTVGGGLITRTSSAVTVRFTPSTSTHYFYSTAPNGDITTSTSLVVVNAPITETAVATGAAGAAQSSAGLQSGADQVSANFLSTIMAFLGATGFLLRI